MHPVLPCWAADSEQTQWCPYGLQSLASHRETPQIPYSSLHVLQHKALAQRTLFFFCCTANVAVVCDLPPISRVYSRVLTLLNICSRKTTPVFRAKATFTNDSALLMQVTLQLVHWSQQVLPMPTRPVHAACPQATPSRPDQLSPTYHLMQNRAGYHHCLAV